ncbi:MAG: MFS transporter [Caldilineaceae bacterium]
MSSRKWFVLAAVSLAAFLGSVDGSVVNAASPILMRELQADFATTQWIILAYLLGLTVLQVGMGRLADLIGKKLVFTTGIVIFLAGSALCGLATSVYWLLLFRFIQSIGASMMLSIGSAILTETWPHAQRGQAIGFTAGIIGLGIIAGPAIGGLLIESLSWHWIFYLNLPVGFVALILALIFAPPMKPQQNHERFDFVGAALLAISLLAFSLALTIAQHQGFFSPTVLLLSLVAVVAFAIFLRSQLRVMHPLVDLALLRNNFFRRNLFTSGCAFMSIATAVYLLPFYLNLVGGLSASGVGWMMAVLPAAMGILQPIAGTLSDRIGARRLILFGLGCMGFGYYTMSTMAVDSSPLAVILRVLPVSVGMAMFYSPNNSAMMGAAPPERLGVASGIASMVRALAQIAGIAISTALFAWRVQVYGGVSVADASREVLVLALRDQMWLVAGVMVFAFVSEVVGEHSPDHGTISEPQA